MQHHPNVSRAAAFRTGAAILVASALPKRALGADLIPLRVGAGPTDATAEIFYGVDKGFYKDAGLDVTITTMFNAGALAAALAAGSLDVVTGTVLPIADAFSHGIDLRVIAPGLIYDKGQGQSIVIVVANASPAKNAVDLNGKTIAINGLHDLTHLSLLSWLGTNGADVKSVKLIEIPFPEMGAALDQGRVDAALIVEPFTSALHGKVRVIGDALAGFGPRWVGTVWASKLTWLADHRDAARRFAAATLKIASWANAHQSESAAVLAQHTSMPLATINGMVRAVYATTPVTGPLLQPLLDSATKYFGTPKLSGSDLVWSG
jgi:NitT/TauT family transport system substrate-binding protein